MVAATWRGSSPNVGGVGRRLNLGFCKGKVLGDVQNSWECARDEELKRRRGTPPNTTPSWEEKEHPCA